MAACGRMQKSLLHGLQCLPLFGPQRPLLAILLLAVALLLPACRGEKQLSGQIFDYASGRPLAGARIITRQSGWGLSNGSLVWDKTYITESRSNSQGEFTLRYRVGDSAKLIVSHPEYQSFYAWYPAGSQVTVHLRRLLVGPPRVVDGYLRFGQKTDGSFYGWNFAAAEMTDDPGQADLFPLAVAPEKGGAIVLGCSGAGGILFVPQAELQVDNLYLLYSDRAPEHGYAQSVELDFKLAGGIYYVRTRDGRHFAKVEFQPSGYFMNAAEDIRRDLSLRYIYNPEASRDLRFQEAYQDGR
jgi:hypothetical protein